MNNAGSVTHKWDLSTPLERRKLKKLNILQWVPSGLHSVPATAKQACLYKLVNGEKYIWSVWHLKMINERASDRINFLSFYVSLASGSTCSLAATRYLEICHWSWPSVSAGLKGLPHQVVHKGALLSVMVAGKIGGARAQGKSRIRQCTLAPCDRMEYHKKAHVKCPISALLLVVCTHTHSSLLTTAARLLTDSLGLEIKLVYQLIHTSRDADSTISVESLFQKMD